MDVRGSDSTTGAPGHSGPAASETPLDVAILQGEVWVQPLVIEASQQCMSYSLHCEGDTSLSMPAAWC